MTAISPRVIAPIRTNIAADAARAAARSSDQAPATDRPNYKAIYASTILAVTALFLFGVAIPTAMVYGNATGWGLGAFCAFWGGPGFGAMAASARVSMWYEANGREF